MSLLAAEPLILELDQETWADFLDRYDAWLGDLLTTQSAFHRLAERTVEIEESHIKAYLADIAASAAAHERQAEALYRLIGREPSFAREVAGAVVSVVRDGAGATVGALGSAAGGWKALRELQIAGLDAMAAFAVAEQLGLALGLPEIVDVTFPVIIEKSTQQLLIQEFVLEMASTAILYHAPA